MLDILPIWIIHAQVVHSVAMNSSDTTTVGYSKTPVQLTSYLVGCRNFWHGYISRVFQDFWPSELKHLDCLHDSSSGLKMDTTVNVRANVEEQNAHPIPINQERSTTYHYTRDEPLLVNYAAAL